MVDRSEPSLLVPRGRAVIDRSGPSLLVPRGKTVVDRSEPSQPLAIIIHPPHWSIKTSLISASTLVLIICLAGFALGLLAGNFDDQLHPACGVGGRPRCSRFGFKCTTRVGRVLRAWGLYQEFFRKSISVSGNLHMPTGAGLLASVHRHERRKPR